MKAAIHVHLGELDQALDLLEAATREHVPAMRVLGVEPIFTALRGNARFEAVLRAAGVQPPEEPTLQASDL